MDKVDIAALLALSSALCVAIGDVLQQRATHRITDTSLGQMQLFAKLARNQRWRWPRPPSSPASTPSRPANGSRRRSVTPLGNWPSFRTEAG